jgi:probable rRNA maturation factor
MPKIGVKIYNTQKDQPISSPIIKKWVRYFLEDQLKNKKLCITQSEISIHLINKKKMGEIHEKFFNDPTPTDCISLPLDPLEFEDSKSPLPQHLLGEIFVCPKIAIEYATAHDLSSERETVLYIIHALLHLLGFDDIDKKERLRMRKEEAACLEKYDCRLR